MIKAVLVCVVGFMMTTPVFAGPAGVSKPSVKHGAFLVGYGGCQDCHTPGWAQNGGQAPKELWLTGGGMNFQGPWGTTYPPNLRLLVHEITLKAWIAGCVP